MTTIDWIKKLIAFDTTSCFSNLTLIEYLANALDNQQIKPILIHDNKEPKANLLATLPGKNGRFDGGSAASDREGYFVLLKGRLGPIAETVKGSAARSHPKCTPRRPRLD